MPTTLPASGARWRRGGLLALLVLASTLTAMLLTQVAAPAQVAASTPWTWGGNSYGELGTGGTASRYPPAAVSLSGVVDLHGGREHVVALRRDGLGGTPQTGTVWTWGSNQYGQLGIGTGGNSATPVQVPGLSGIVAVETGHNHSMALGQGGSVWTWGYNTDGQLGDGTTTRRTTPVLVSGLTDAVAIAAGRNMSYAIRANGQLVAWGANNEGQLGDGTLTRRLTPVRVGTLTGVVAITGGRDHGLARLGDGSAWVWGSNDYGQLGLGNSGASADRTSPMRVLASGVAEVAAGAHHSYALTQDGQVWAWGRNYRANLGDGTTSQRNTPVQVVGVNDAVGIAAGRDHGLAVRADGRVQAWGANASGQLGDGTTTQRATAILVPGLTGVTQVGGGGASYSVVLVGDGPPLPNQPPTAAVSASCQYLTCTFNAGGSTDPDGRVVAWSWDFGDGSQGSGAQATHTYGQAGSYQVTLTVTDDDGAPDSESGSATPTDPPAGGVVEFVGSSQSNGNVTTASVQVPSAVQSQDRLLLFVSAAAVTTASTPSGWTLVGTVTDGTDVRSWLYTRLAVAGSAGSTVQVPLGTQAKVAVHLAAYRGATTVTAASLAEAGSGASHVAPGLTVLADGATVLRMWADKSSTAHGWTLPAPMVARGATQGSGGGLMTSVLGDQAQVPAGALAPATAVPGVASSKAISWTVALTG